MVEHHCPNCRCKHINPLPVRRDKPKRKKGHSFKPPIVRQSNVPSSCKIPAIMNVKRRKNKNRGYNA